METPVKTSFHLVLLAIVALVFGPIGYVHAQSTPATIVLVHGAFADGASWGQTDPDASVERPQVVAVHLPLSSLADDVAVTRRAIAAQDGPVVLVGYSWGGMIISVAGSDEKVKSLVYVSAFMPDEGERYIQQSYADRLSFKNRVRLRTRFL
jgi:pimeloyl-ACP methyl ester carboxylesterase